MRDMDSPRRWRCAAALTGQWSEEVEILQLCTLQKELMDVHVSVMRLHESEPAVDLTVERICSSVLPVTRGRDGLTSLSVGLSAMSCWFSGNTQEGLGPLCQRHILRSEFHCEVKSYSNCCYIINIPIPDQWRPLLCCRTATCLENSGK